MYSCYFHNHKKKTANLLHFIYLCDYVSTSPLSLRLWCFSVLKIRVFSLHTHPESSSSVKERMKYTFAKSSLGLMQASFFFFFKHFARCLTLQAATQHSKLALLLHPCTHNPSSTPLTNTEFVVSLCGADFLPFLQRLKRKLFFFFAAHSAR